MRITKEMKKNKQKTVKFADNQEASLFSDAGAVASLLNPTTLKRVALNLSDLQKRTIPSNSPPSDFKGNQVMVGGQYEAYITYGD